MMALAFAVAVLCAATAHAAHYKTLYCAAADGSGDPTKGARPGFFDFTDDCGTAYGDPAGTGGFLRLEENTTGTAGNTDEASYSWWAPSGTSISAVSAYTRVPGWFNSGWRQRFWGEGFDGSENNVLMQGSGVPYDGIYAPATSNFVYHAWPFGGFGDYKRLVFAMTCYRPAGCSREGWNAADANSIAITLDDKSAAQVNWEGDSHVLAGDWVRDYNPIAWRESDVGSGLRLSRLEVDGAPLSDGTIDYQQNGGCRTGRSDANGEFARDFEPCTKGPYLRYYGLQSAAFADGQHEISICAQDFGQYQHVGGQSSESCDRRTIHTDNTAPGKPAELGVTSTNPERYLDHFGAAFSLPPDSGSPIARVHYEVLNAKGEVLVPERTVAARNPTSLSNVEGPSAPGAYTLRVWLEDSVGFTGPAAEAPIPHDTTPPAAPQSLRVAGAAGRWVDSVDLRWQNVPDAGSPIEVARYQLIDGAGEALGAPRALSAADVQAIDDIATPERRGEYAVRVWLADAEGNVGSAASVPLPRDTTPPAAPQDVSVAAPGLSRSSEGFDVRWRNIADAGSPISAAHYEVLNGAGRAVVPRATVTGRDIDAIAELQTPREGGHYTLRLWLSDGEGNAGAPVSVPLAYDCVRSDAQGGSVLSAGFGEPLGAEEILRQGRGGVLRGKLRGEGSVGTAGAALCVFSSVLEEDGREFLGIAMTSEDGGYRFAVPAGPSRVLEVLYRPGQRRLSAQATSYTRVRPALRVHRRAVRVKRFARFTISVPGPRKDRVVVVLQVKQGKGARAFRRCRTQADGSCSVRYRFGKSAAPGVYLVRAQVRRQGYPYLPGSSRWARLRVLPNCGGAARRAARGHAPHRDRVSAGGRRR